MDLSGPNVSACSGLGVVTGDHKSASIGEPRVEGSRLKAVEETRVCGRGSRSGSRNERPRATSDRSGGDKH